LIKSSLFIFMFLSFGLSASEAVGYYTRGSVKNSVAVYDYSSSHMVKLYNKRGQNYGTKEVMLALSGLSDYMKSNYPTIEKMQIGDIAAHKGGRIKRHKSHQNGLDADAVYYRVNEYQQPVDFPEWKEDFVKNGKLTKNFHIERNWEAFKYLVNNHNVGRIFVDGVIKKAMCNYSKSIGEYSQEKEVLRRLRPENSVHMHHFHLRLKCPSGNRKCRKQREPSKGSGC